MPHISYVDPATVDDPELQAIMERARVYGTPRPESQAIRLHHPEVMKAFNNAGRCSFAKAWRITRSRSCAGSTSQNRSSASTAADRGRCSLNSKVRARPRLTRSST